MDCEALRSLWPDTQVLVDLPLSSEDSGVRVRAKGETSLLVLMGGGGLFEGESEDHSGAVMTLVFQ